MIVTNVESEITLIREIIRLNNLDNNIKKMFGYSNDDTELELAVSNLFEVLLFVIELNNMADDVFDIVFDENNCPDDSVSIYNKLMKIKENN